MAAGVSFDGRHARRERSRRSVIDAAFELIQEGKLPPSLEDVADRAGVSASSIFRNFDGLADVQRQALDTFYPRFADLFVVDGTGLSRAERVRAHVRARVELSAVAGGLMLVARSRALEHDPMVEGMAQLRGRLADQTRNRFGPELRQLTPAEAANLGALIDSVTSPEAFELMGAAHSRSPRQISKTWVAALDVLLEQWVPSASAGSDGARPSSLTKSTEIGTSE